MGRGRVKLTEVNPHLVCVLCRGYLIDATTITECLHSFCRSCIILYLERKSYCPICEVQIHKTKPYLNLKLDKTLQDIVYKLVPGLFHNEMRRRQEFYKSHPLHDRHLHPESRGIAIDRLIYSPDDSISLSLEYYDKQREREEWTSVGDTNTVATHGAEGKRFLLCPAVVTMGHLKKFLRSKYNLPDTATVEVLYRRESLPDSYSLMDVAYIYTWKQNEPMRFYYRIHVLTKCIKDFPELETIDRLENQSEVTLEQEEETSKTIETCEKDFSTKESRFSIKLNVSIDAREKIKNFNGNLSSLANKNVSLQINTSNVIASSSSLINGINPKNCTIKNIGPTSQEESVVKCSNVSVKKCIAVNIKNGLQSLKENSVPKLSEVISESKSVREEKVKLVSVLPTAPVTPDPDETSNENDGCDNERVPITSSLKNISDKNENSMKENKINKPEMKLSTISSNLSCNGTSVTEISEGLMPIKPITSDCNVLRNFNSNSSPSKDFPSKPVQKETSNVSSPNQFALKNLCQNITSSDATHSKATLKFEIASNRKLENSNKNQTQKVNNDLRTLTCSKTTNLNSSLGNSLTETKFKPSSVGNSLSIISSNNEFLSKEIISNKCPSKANGELRVTSKDRNKHQLKTESSKDLQNNKCPDLNSLKNSLSEDKTNFITGNKNSSKIIIAEQKIASKITVPDEEKLSESIVNGNTKVEMKSCTSSDLGLSLVNELENKDKNTENTILKIKNYVVSQNREKQKLETNLSDSLEFPETREASVTELDESAAALLSAIGLQPKSKTSPIKVGSNETGNSSKICSDEGNNNSIKNDSIQSEKTKSLSSNKNSEPGCSSKRPFRSDHDELSVSLLLGLSNGHVDKSSESRQNPDDNARRIKERSDSKTPTSETVENKTEATVSSPINSIEKVVNNITPLSKNSFKLPQHNLVCEKKDDLFSKGSSGDTSQLKRLNGFKVPQSPTLGVHPFSNGSRKSPGSRVISPKNIISANNKIFNPEKVIPEETAKKVTICGSKIDINKTFPTASRPLCNRPLQLFKSSSFRTTSVSSKVSKPTLQLPSVKASIIFNNEDKSTVIEPDYKSEEMSAKEMVSRSSKHLDNTEKKDNEGTCVNVKNESVSKLTSECQKIETVTKKIDVENENLCQQSEHKPSPSGVKSPSTVAETITQGDSKVNLLKRKLNSQQNECDVIVSAATRDDSLTEAKKRKQVTPDVSIELFSGPPNERSSIKRPFFEYPSLTKKLGSEKDSVKSSEGNQSEIRINKIDQLCASSVKIEKVSTSQINHINVKNMNKERLSGLPDIKSSDSNSERKLSCSAKSDPSGTSIGDDTVTPDITIEKMKDSPKQFSKKPIDSNCEVKVTKVADVSLTKSHGNLATKRKTDSPSTSSVNDPDSPSNAKKMPRLIEINAPPRPKLDPNFQERKNQRTGLKMTTVRKEVPIGKEVPLVRKDCNGALDLSGKNTAKPSPSRPPSLVTPSEMFPAAALHQFFRQQLELQSRLLASHANNNLGRDWRKEPLTSKHLEDWVRNAVSCGALPPHPLMFNPNQAPPSPHRK